MSAIDLSVFEQFPVIETKRLLLRAFQLEDAEAILNMRSNPRVSEFIRRGPLDGQGAREIVEKVQQGFADKKNIGWAGVHKESGQFIGACGFNRIDFDDNRAEIGGEMMVNYWGKKMALEATQQIVNFGFQAMNLHSIEAWLWPENRGAVHLLEQLGFEKEAHFKKRLFNEGLYRDVVVYTCFRPD